MAVLVRLGGALGGLGVVGWLLARFGPSAAVVTPPGHVPGWLAAAPVEERVVSLAAHAAWGCLAWLAFVLVAVAAGAYPPGAVRDVAGRVLGVAVVGAAAGALVASPAVAADGPFDRPAGSPPRPGPRSAVSAVVGTPPPRTSPPPTSPPPAAPAPIATTAVAPTPTAEASTAPGAPEGSGRAGVTAPAAPAGPAAPSGPDVAAAARAGSPAPTGPHRAPRTYVVRPGDTLWGITARHLGAAAPPSLVAATWPRWYAANRPLVGPDPHRIRPGQRLVPPASHGDSR